MLNSCSDRSRRETPWVRCVYSHRANRRGRALDLIELKIFDAAIRSVAGDF